MVRREHRLGMAGLWHLVLFRNSLMLIYHYLALLKWGMYGWCDFMAQLAPTWRWFMCRRRRR